MLNRFGHFLLQSRMQAALMALLFSFMPLFGWVSTVIIGLVTLRKGPLEGLWIVLWGSLGDVVFAVIASSFDPIVFGVIAGNGYVWLIAWVLYLSLSWTRVLETSLILGVLGVLVVHLWMPNISQWWLEQFQAVVSKTYADSLWVAQMMGLQNEQEWNIFIQQVEQGNELQFLAYIMSGMLAGLLIIVRLIKLALARWWQAALFNPGGLRTELLRVRLGYVSTGILVVAFIAALAGVTLVWDMLPVLVVIFMLAGLSVAHYFAGKQKFGVVWLTLLYLLLVVLTPYALALLMSVAVADSLINLRDRIGHQTTKR